MGVAVMDSDRVTLGWKTMVCRKSAPTSVRGHSLIQRTAEYPVSCLTQFQCSSTATGPAVSSLRPGVPGASAS